MNEEIVYEVEIRTGISHKMYKRFESEEACREEIKQRKAEGFKNLKIRKTTTKTEYL